MLGCATQIQFEKLGKIFNFDYQNDLFKNN